MPQNIFENFFCNKWAKCLPKLKCKLKILLTKSGSLTFLHHFFQNQINNSIIVHSAYQIGNYLYQYTTQFGLDFDIF